MKNKNSRRPPHRRSFAGNLFKREYKTYWIIASILMSVLVVSLVVINAADLKKFISNSFGGGLQSPTSEADMAGGDILTQMLAQMDRGLLAVWDSLPRLLSGNLGDCIRTPVGNDPCSCLNSLLDDIMKRIHENVFFGYRLSDSDASSFLHIFNYFADVANSQWCQGASKVGKIVREAWAYGVTYKIARMVASTVRDFLRNSLPKNPWGQGFTPRHPAISPVEYLNTGPYQATAAYLAAQQLNKFLGVLTLAGLLAALAASGAISVVIPIVGWCGRVTVVFAQGIWGGLSAGAMAILQRLAQGSLSGAGAPAAGLATVLVGAHLNAQGGTVTAQHITDALTQYGFDPNDPNAPQDPNMKAAFEQRVRDALRNGRESTTQICTPGVTGPRPAPVINLEPGRATGYTSSSGTVVPSSTTPGQNDCNYGFATAKVLRGGDVADGMDDDQAFVQTDQGMSVGVSQGQSGIESDAGYSAFVRNPYTGVDVELPPEAVYDNQDGFGFFAFNGRVGHRVGIDCRFVRETFDSFAQAYGSTPVAHIFQVTIAITEDNCEPVFVTKTIDCSENPTGTGSTGSSSTGVTYPGQTNYGPPAGTTCSYGSHQCRQNSDCAQFGAGATCTQPTAGTLPSSWCMCINPTSGTPYPVPNIYPPGTTGGGGTTPAAGCDADPTTVACNPGICPGNSYCNPGTCTCFPKTPITCGQGPPSSTQYCNTNTVCPNPIQICNSNCVCTGSTGPDIGGQLSDTGNSNNFVGLASSTQSSGSGTYSITTRYWSDGSRIYERSYYPLERGVEATSIKTYNLEGILLESVWTDTYFSITTTYTYDSYNRLFTVNSVDSNGDNLRLTYTYDDVANNGLPIPVSLSGEYSGYVESEEEGAEIFVTTPIYHQFVITSIIYGFDENLYSIAEYDLSDGQTQLVGTTIVKYDSSITTYRNPTVPVEEFVLEEYSLPSNNADPDKEGVSNLLRLITRIGNEIWTEVFQYGDSLLMRDTLTKSVNNVNVKVFDSTFTYGNYNGDMLLDKVSTSEDGTPLVELRVGYESNNALTIPRLIYLYNPQTGVSFSYSGPVYIGYAPAGGGTPNYFGPIGGN